MEGRPQVKRALPTLSGGFGSGCAGRPACLAFPAGVRVEGGGAEGLEPGEQFVQPPVMPNSGRCVLVYLCVALHIVNGGGRRQFSLEIQVVGTPKPSLREWECLFVFEMAWRSVRLLRVGLTAAGTRGRWRSVG
jgi:hypothetical protein